MRVAALYDIHANPVALRAVLAELEREQVDLIVVGGDAVPGPLPRPTIELLRALGDRAVFVRGNTDRWTVEEFDALAGVGSDQAASRAAGRGLDGDDDRPGTARLPGLLPGAPGHRRRRPRRDPVLPRIASIRRGDPHPAHARGALGADVRRRRAAPRRLWPHVRAVRPLRTDYDIRAAEAELRGGGWPGVDDFLRNSFLEPADPLTVAEALERQAQET
jgi:Calcineurin-like phosphoesterase superfamily domain